MKRRWITLGAQASAYSVLAAALGLGMVTAIGAVHVGWPDDAGAAELVRVLADLVGR